MTRFIILSAILVFTIGCTGGDASKTQDNLSESIQGVEQAGLTNPIATIQIGTSEEDLVASLADVTIDSGTMYWGGSGAKRMYFQITENQQIWFEIGGSNRDQCGKVMVIGPIGPKTPWIRSRGARDSIVVATD